MAILERHSYKKVDGEWQITKTMSLTYEKIPYSLSCLSSCALKLKNCYHTTQAMYYLLDTDTLDIMSADDWRGEKHWWLRDREIDYDIDLTSEQYYLIDKKPPYLDGKISKWYGWKGRPHGRTLKLIKKMQPDIANIKIMYYN